MTVRVDGLSPCSACGGKLFPLILCDSCGAATIVRDVPELDWAARCSECGTLNGWELICDACRTRFPVPGRPTPSSGRSPTARGPPSSRDAPRLARRVKGDVDTRALADLLKVLGIDASRTRALIDRGYDAPWKIAREKEAVLARIPEVGPVAARKIVASFRLVSYEPQKRTKEAIARDEHACPLCGCVTSAFAATCVECGAAFDEQEMEEDVRESFAAEGQAALLAFYEARLAERPNDWELSYALGLALESLGRHDEAMAALDRAASLAPDAKKVRVAQLRFRANQVGKPEDAEKLRSTAKSLLEDVAWEQEVAQLDRLISEAGRECPHCGAAVPAEMALCPSCGTRLSSPPPGAKARTPSATPELDAVMDDLLVGELEESLSPEELELTKAAVLDWLILELEETMAPETQVLHPTAKRPEQPAPAEAPAPPTPLADSMGFLSRWMQGSRGLVSSARPKAGPRGGGRVNGLVNGQGRVNGLVNGLGRTNGLVNGVGRVNGLATPVGRVNGLVTTRGRVNGLVGVQGRINGIAARTSFVRPFARGLRLPYPSRRVRYAATVASILVAVLIAGLVFVPLPGPAGPIAIDGAFGDWASVPMFDAATVTAEGNVSLARYAALLDRDSLYLFASTRGGMLGDAVEYDGLYFFIDGDGDPTTGYAFDGLGAEAVAELFGGNHRVDGARLRSFPAESEVNWSQGQSIRPVRAAASAQGLEAAVSTVDIDRFDATGFRIGVYADDFRGASSRGTAFLNPAGAAILLEVQPLATIVGASPSALFDLRVRGLGLRPSQALTVSNFEVSVTPGVTYSLSPESVTVTPGQPTATVVAAVSAPGLSPGDVVQVDVTGASAPHPVVVRGGPVRAYVQAPPSSIRIDGLFADWIGQDVPDSDPVDVENPNVDVVEYGGVVDPSNVFFHVAVAGDILEGRIPQRIIRSAPSQGGNVSDRPIPLPRQTGEDILRIYIDVNSTDVLGSPLNGILADYLFEIRGKTGQIRSQTLFEWRGAWVPVTLQTISVAKDRTDIEGSLPIPPTNRTRMVFTSTDWSDNRDQTAPVGQAVPRRSHATRVPSIGIGSESASPKGPPVVLDISGNGGFWFRDTSHAETACTHNKVAASTKGSGPKQTITLLTTQAACWYVDETSGQTIPAGSWETLLDITVTVAEYDVRFEIWNKPSDTIAEAIGSCNDVTTSGSDVQCLVTSVPQKTLTGDQVVRIVIAHSALSGSVAIEYDDPGSTGDSRVTLPLPEFEDVLIPLFATLLIAWAGRAGSRRRRAP